VMKRFGLLLFVLIGLVSSSAVAQVRVVKGAGSKSTINWVGFVASSSPAGALFRQTLQADLIRSGWFTPAGVGAEFTLAGTCEDSGSLKVRCYVTETAIQRNVMSKSYSAAGAEARTLAHRVADDIIEAVTGRRGMSSVRLVAVGNRTGHKELYLLDSDGQNVRQLTPDGSIALAPSWGPDGRTIVYTSFHQRYPDLYMYNLDSGERKRVSGFPGLNTGGAISPDGREMALILSKDGNPDLYVMNLRNRELTRITTTPRAAEASPCWSPDGSRICFVSDGMGSPQIYIISREGGRPVRVSGMSPENVAPDWGANGWIAYTSRQGGRYVVCVLDPETKQTKQISPSDADYEDPSWAPDGRHIVCSRTRAYRSALYVLDTLGDAPFSLLETKGDWYSPACSPK